MWSINILESYTEFSFEYRVECHYNEKSVQNDALKGSRTDVPKALSG